MGDEGSSHVSYELPQLWDGLERLRQLLVGHEAAERLKVCYGDGHLWLVVAVLVHLHMPACPLWLKTSPRFSRPPTSSHGIADCYPCPCAHACSLFHWQSDIMMVRTFNFIAASFGEGPSN